MNHEKLVQAARMILEAIGENPAREGLLETPERMARRFFCATGFATPVQAVRPSRCRSPKE